MQITDLTSGEAEVVTEAGDIVTELSRADTHSSVEALCRVWRQSRSDDLPHICSSLHNIVIHLNDTVSGDQPGLWSPVSHLYDSSFYSARNIVISACLMVVFTLLLALATFLATKYRRKTVAQTPEYELETLTGKGGHSDSPPPEYHSILVTRGAEHQEDDTLPPDYFDDIVNKVVI